MRLNKYFEYKKAHHAYQGGTIGARLMGSFVSSKEVTTKGSPYELLVSFSSEIKREGLVTVSGIQLYDAVSNELVFSSGETFKEKLNPGSDGVYRAYFAVKNIDLKYVRYKLVLKFQIGMGEDIIEKQVELYFDEDYKEFKSNDLWQKIMSV